MKNLIICNEYYSLKVAKHENKLVLFIREIMDTQRFERTPIWMPNQDSGGKMKIFMKATGDKHGIKFSKWKYNFNPFI